MCTECSLNVAGEDGGNKQFTVFDVGANIGLFALEALKRSGGTARVLCFEPLPSTFDVLEKNTFEVCVYQQCTNVVPTLCPSRN
jgi:predicted RNA methylase